MKNLTEEAMNRGLDALQTHKENCEKHQVSAIKVIATSAVRSASNGADFVKRVKEELGLEIEVIDGEREAELIWKGVRLTGLLDHEVGLIMDIGGGSTEFILADAEQVHWKRSYDLGVTRLAERFQAPDPFTEPAEREMNEALIEELEELWTALRAAPCQRLIGASGSFNSISTMLVEGDLGKVLPIHQAIDVRAYETLSLTLRRSRFHQRYAIPGLVPDRVDTIPYSVLLIDTVLASQPLWTIERSSYALKEGVMAEMMARS